MPIAGTRAAGTDDGPALSATFTRPNGIGVGPAGRHLYINDLTVGPGLGRGVNVVSLRVIQLMSLSAVMADMDAAAAPDEIDERYTDYRSTRDSENTSADAIALGYQWLTAGRFPQAQRIFQLNAQSYPDDANSQFHYGELFRFTGQAEQAAAQYRRVLELQPDHPTAPARLAEVTGG